MSNKKLNVLIIGAGRISDLNTLGYLESEDANIYAVCDTKNKRARKKAEKWGAKKVYTDYHKALKDEKVDIVEVLTPHALHERIVVEACENGKHVSVQKPPALKLSEMDNMIHAARKNNVKLKVFENFRFHTPYIRAMELIKEDTIGEVNSVNYRMWSSINPISAWKVPLMTWQWRIQDKHNYKLPTLFDDGYHKHSIVHMFLSPDKIKSVQAWKGRFKIYNLIPIDMPAVVIYKVSNTKYGVWNCSIGNNLPIKSDYYGCDEFVEIQGDKGIIFINGCTGNMFVDCNCGGPGKPGVYWLDKNGIWHSDCQMETNWKYSFINSTKHFIKCIKEDLKPILDGKTAREILQISLAMVKSIRSNNIDIEVSSIKDGID
ncbi:MAG: Gfo/Idh/MocA family protein [Candidatus Helarchaeota archaeon]